MSAFLASPILTNVLLVFVVLGLNGVMRRNEATNSLLNDIKSRLPA